MLPLVGLRLGRNRVPDCECRYDFTCGRCLQAAPPWFNTPIQSFTAWLDFQERLDAQRHKGNLKKGANR